MHAIIEKAYRQFAELQQDPSKADSFFEDLWPHVIGLPKDETAELLQKILDWANEDAANRLHILTLATFTLGQVNILSSKYEEGLLYYNKVLAMFKEQDDERGIAMCQVATGAVYRILGNVDLATKYLMDGLGYLLKTGASPIWIAIGCFNLGGIYTTTKNYESSSHYYELVFKYSPVKHMIALAWNGIAENHMYQDNYPEAKECLDKALAEMDDDKLHPNVAKILTDLAAWHQHMGHLEEARQCNLESLKIRELTNMHAGVVTNMQNIAAIYEQEHKTPEAIQTLHDALALAERIKIKPKILQIHHTLSGIYKGLGETEKSYEHFIKFHEVNAEVNEEDVRKKVKNMELIFEGEQTKKENAIIKAQKKEIEEKNIALQETIDELTRVKVSRKAKAIAFMITIVLMVVEDAIMHFGVHPFFENNFYISFAAKVIIVICFKPIEEGIEHYLLHKVVFKKKKVPVVQ